MMFFSSLRSVFEISMKTLIFLLLVTLFFGCAKDHPNRNPTGEIFPDVMGESLEKKGQSIPKDFLGEEHVFLLGYVQDSQFDIDRWLIGLDMTKTQVKAIELPTIQGLFPRMFKTRINDGMRKGIPKPLWGGVITIYEDGETVQKFTGNQNANNSRVLLLDSEAKVRYFHDEGFSVDALNRLREKLSEIRK